MLIEARLREIVEEFARKQEKTGEDRLKLLFDIHQLRMDGRQPDIRVTNEEPADDDNEDEEREEPTSGAPSLLVRL